MPEIAYSEFKNHLRQRAHADTFRRHVNENLSREDQIAERAHELWQRRNSHHGNDLADWFQAEREIDE
jgi:hypothetical protein